MESLPGQIARPTMQAGVIGLPDPAISSRALDRFFRTGGIASSSNNLPTWPAFVHFWFVLFLFLFSGSHSLPQHLTYLCWAFWRLKYKVTCKNEPTPSKQIVLFRVDLKEAALCFEISDKGLATTQLHWLYACLRYRRPWVPTLHCITLGTVAHLQPQHWRGTGMDISSWDSSLVR